MKSDPVVYDTHPDRPGKLTVRQGEQWLTNDRDGGFTYCTEDGRLVHLTERDIHQANRLHRWYSDYRETENVQAV